VSALYSGWADQQLGALYAIVERKMEQFNAGSTERGCLADALKQIELADVHVEKRQKETAE
jgi:hypothetical protein